MRTTRIVNIANRSAANNTSTFTIMSALVTPLTSRQVQQQSPILISAKSEMETFKFTPEINTDVRDLENLNPYAQKASAKDTTSTGKQRSHSPTRITEHDKFKFDFRTLQQRMDQAEAREIAPSRTIQLRS